MTKPDHTPLPVVAPRHSAESSGAFPVTVTQRRQAQATRGIVKSILFPVAFGAAIVGPHLIDQTRATQREEVKAAIQNVEAKPESKTLQDAQLRAIGKFFGLKDGAYNVKDAEKMMKAASERTGTEDWRLQAANLVDPNQVKVSEDGKSFEVDGQNYSFAEVRAKDGNLYVVAARVVEEDNLIGDDRWHMVSPMLVGGARSEKGMTPEQLTERAYDDTRSSLHKSFEASKNTLRLSTGGENNKIKVSSLDRK